MSINIKVEKDYKAAQSNKDIIPISLYNKLCADHENLKLILSLKSKKCEEHIKTINTLNEKIEEQNKDLLVKKTEIDNLKQKQENDLKTFAWKDLCNKEVYNALSGLRSLNYSNTNVSDPKTAVMRINEADFIMKQLNNEINENKILVLTLCKMLNCEDVKIIQQMKNILHENDLYKKNNQKLQHFFQRSMEFTNNLCADLHKTGAMSSLSTVSVASHIENEGVAGFEKRMAFTRLSCLQKVTKTLNCIPKFNVYGKFPRNDSSRLSLDNRVGSTSSQVITNRNITVPVKESEGKTPAKKARIAHDDSIMAII